MKKRYIFLLILLGVISFILVRELNHKPSYIEYEEYKQDTSTLIIPIQIDIPSFEPTFNQSMEKQGWFYEQKNIQVNKQLSLSFRVKKEGHAQLYPANDAINLQLPLAIEIFPKLKGPLSLGIARNMQLESKVLLTSALTIDISEDWKLLTNASTSFEIQQAPELNVLGFAFDFEKQLKQNLEEGLKEINQQIEQQVAEAINTEDIVAALWKEIKEPYKLDHDIFQAYLNIHPVAVYTSDLKPAGPGIIQTTFKIHSLLNVHTKAITLQQKSLPKASRISSINDDYTVLFLPLFADYHTLSDLLNQQENGYTIPINSSISLHTNHFEMSRIKNNIQIKADFTSTNQVKGEIIMNGQIAFDPTQQMFAIKNVSLAAKSNNKMVDGIVNNVQKSKSFKAMLENKLQFSMQEQLSSLIFQSSELLNEFKINDYTQLKGYFDYIKISSIHLQEEGILLATESKLSTTCMVKANVINN